MQEERMAILKMIQEGKISAQEGVELLKALGARPGAGGAKETGPFEEGRSRSEDSWDRGRWEGPRFRPPVPPRPRSILEDVLDGVSLGFPFGMFGDTYRFEEDHEGRFEVGPDTPVSIRLHTSNGRLIVRAWERPDYRVHIVKSLRGTGEAEARQRAERMAQFSATPGGLTVESRTSGWSNAGVAAEVYLPANLLYGIELHTSNGRIEADGLKVDRLTAHTSNGRIVCERTSGRAIIVHTSNGRIIAGCSARQVEAETSNGSITVLPQGDVLGDSRYRLHTSNGSIKVRADDRTGAGYDIDASTSIGQVELELPDLDYAIRERAIGHRRSKARTRGFEGKERRIYVDARTSNGSVLVSPSV